MKRFTLTVNGVTYVAEGTALKDVEGWNGKLPDVWVQNYDDIVVEDITDEIAENEQAKLDQAEAIKLIGENLPKLKELLGVS